MTFSIFQRSKPGSLISKTSRWICVPGRLVHRLAVRRRALYLDGDVRVDALRPFGLPVILDAWMSKKLHLLSECVGHEIPEGTPYDPLENLKELRRNYPDYGLYLAILGFKTQYPLLPTLFG